jgi:hypothetical protein
MEKAELAWPEGDRPPADAGFHYVLTAERQALLLALLPAALAGQVTAIRAIATTDALAGGRYMLELDDGAPLFLRATTRLGDGATERALVDHAAAYGVSVVPYTHMEAMEVGGYRLRVDLRSFRSGRHPEAADAPALAAELRRLHDALAGFPGRDTIRANARVRFARLQAFSDELALGHTPPLTDQLAAWFASHGAWATECAAELSPLSMIEAADAQCLHGEVTPANLLMDGQKPVLIDFEEATHVFATPLWDLATLVQRLLLVDDPPKKVVCTRIANVEAAYGRSLCGLFNAMRSVAWATTMMILDSAAAGVAAPVSECVKFHRLERQAATLSKTIPKY